MTSRPSLAAVGIFLFFGAAMALLAAATLLWPGTLLDRAWLLNPTAYQQLHPLRRIAAPFFFVLSAALLIAGTGWFQRRLWSWRLTIVIIAIQTLGDLVNAFRGEWLKGTAGAVIAGALMLYLLRRDVRSAFGQHKSR